MASSAPDNNGPKKYGILLISFLVLVGIFVASQSNIFVMNVAGDRMVATPEFTEAELKQIENAQNASEVADTKNEEASTCTAERDIRKHL